MKFLDKLGLAIFSIITLVLAIVLCLIGFGWMEPTIFSILIGKILISQTYTYVMIAICIILILLAIRCIFFSDVDEKKSEADSGILLQNEDGKLLITVETLKNMVTGVVGEFEEVLSSDPSVSITKDNEIIIDVSIDVARRTVIKNISSKIQMEIKKVIKEATGLDIESVNVRVRNVENDIEVSDSVDKIINEELDEKEKINKEQLEDKNNSSKQNDKKNSKKQTQNKTAKKTK